MQSLVCGEPGATQRHPCPANPELQAPGRKNDVCCKDANMSGMLKHADRLVQLSGEGYAAHSPTTNVRQSTWKKEAER